MAIAAGLGVGAVCGFVNGFLIARFRIAPFIATLGMFTAARGLALIYSDGRPISKLEHGYNWLGQGAILGVPVPIILLELVALGAHLMLKSTRFGRYIYAIGGNEQAARVSGVNLSRAKIGIYTFSGPPRGPRRDDPCRPHRLGQPAAGHRHRARRDHRRGHRRDELLGRHRHGLGGHRRRSASSAR